jgi:outer membrane protein assembly factor BamB
MSTPSTAPRTGRIVAALGVLVVLAAVAVVAVLVAGGSDDAPDGDLGSGPRDQPEEAWTEVLDLTEETELRVVADRERVFVLASTLVLDDEDLGTDATLTAWAADDGEELWSVPVSVPGLADAPLPLGDRLLVIEQDDEGIDSTRLLDAATGEEVWTAEGRPATAYASSGPTPTAFAATADPLLFEDAGGDDGHVAAVDLATGEVLWEEEAGEADPCGDVVVAASGEDAEADGTLVARRFADGDELWTAEGQAGGCDEDVVAVSTAPDEVAILDLASGEERSVIAVPDGDEPWRGAPFGDHVVVNRITFGDDATEGTIDAAVHPIDGGGPTWEGEAIAGALDEERVLLLTEDERLTIIRAADGEELGSVRYGEGGSCGALTAEVVLGCDEDGGPTVTGYSLTGAPERIWTVDVGSDVTASALGGDTLYVATDTELIALR